MLNASKSISVRLLALLTLTVGAAFAQLVQSAPKLVSSDEALFAQGASVAMSGDGRTVVLGGPGDPKYVGGAWVFGQNSGVWSQQGRKLVETIEPPAWVGEAVAISADGNTVLVGGHSFGGTLYDARGAVWVYVRNGNAWTLQSRIVAADASPQSRAFGIAAALSADGNTALIGAPVTNGRIGAAYVFVRAGNIWARQAQLIGSGAQGESYQGNAVALSADGSTALISGEEDSSYRGAAWVFTRSAGVWTQQGKLVDSQTNGAQQGHAVALSADGNTAVLGTKPNTAVGGQGAWVYARSGATWLQQGRIFSRQFTEEGRSVALSSDGNTALLGVAYGAVLWSRSGGRWVQQGGLRQTEGVPDFCLGTSLALSADGRTAVLGDYCDKSSGAYFRGSALIFGIPDLAVTMTHAGIFRQGDAGSYSISVSNVGTASTQSGTNVNVGLPLSMSAVTISGAGWACDMVGRLCNRTDPLPAGSAYPPITVAVSVDPNAPPSAVAMAAISTSVDGNSNNDKASDLANIVQMPDLTINKTDDGAFVQGDVGRQYLITVRNGGSAASLGIVTLTDMLPTGLTATSFAGSGWTCALASMTCVRNDSLAPGQSYPVVTLTVNVAFSVPAALTNTVRVSGGGEIFTANNSFSDPTIVNAAAVRGLVNSAGYQVGSISAEGLFTVFGSNLSTQTQLADVVTPGSLAGTTVTLIDSTGQSRRASLLYVSPGQINLLAPTGLVPGAATLIVENGSGGAASTQLQVSPTAPGLFSADQTGRGVAAAVVVSTAADGETSTRTAARWDTLSEQWIAVPIDVTTTSGQVYLSLYGTGIRGRSSLASVTVTAGGIPVDVQYAGAHPEYPGLDQVNVRLPPMLAGMGEIAIRLTINGYPANIVSINMR